MKHGDIYFCQFPEGRMPALITEEHDVLFITPLTSKIIKGHKVIDVLGKPHCLIEGHKQELLLFLGWEKLV